jgi:magnesium transporter
MVEVVGGCHRLPMDRPSRAGYAAPPTPSIDLEAAISHATVRVPIGARDDLAGDVRSALAGVRFEWAGDLAVLEDGSLAGMVAVEDLLAADPDVRLEALMDREPPVVHPGCDQEAAAWAMVKRGESSLAVVDEDGRFHGFIPPERMLAVMLAEHDEDLARIGGYVRGSTRAREAAQERVVLRLWHRLPWLLLGLIGALGSAALVGAFEHQLDQKVLIAFFVPGIVYMAAAVGTQTEAILIRGMAVGIGVGSVVRRELISGVLVGLVVGTCFFSFALLTWGDAPVAAAAGLALFASCSVATLVAMTLPWIFQRLGRDPAFGSGPLATVLQDLLSIAVYLTLASWIAL